MKKKVFLMLLVGAFLLVLAISLTDIPASKDNIVGQHEGAFLGIIGLTSLAYLVHRNKDV